MPCKPLLCLRQPVEADGVLQVGQLAERVI